MHKGDLSAQADLMDFKDTKHLYALGAVESLKGEILFLDSKPFISSVQDQKLNISNSFEHKATLLVYASVDQWTSTTLPDQVSTYADLEKHIEQTAKDNGINTDEPFPFLLNGRLRSFDWHVIDWKDGDTEHSHEKHITSGLHGTMTDQDVEVLGFYSNSHHAIFTHHTTNMHLHVKTTDNSISGHLDGLTLGPGMTLQLPAIINETETPRPIKTAASVSNYSGTTRTYISDASYLNYDYPTELKNGYRLEYRVYVEPNASDTLQTIFLMKGATEIKDLNGGSSYDLPHKNIGYTAADFDRSFVFAQSFGAGNPSYIQLIDKESGEELLRGTWVDAEEHEQLLLYIEDEHEATEQLKLYDAKNENERIVRGFERSKCREQVTGGLGDCVAIDSATTSEIILKMDTGEETIDIKYKRQQKP